MRLKLFLFQCYDISYAYIKYVLFHRCNKLNERHIRFIDEADWVSDNRFKQKLLVKIKELNNYKTEQ
jgi:hypothetical protein